MQLFSWQRHQRKQALPSRRRPRRGPTSGFLPWMEALEDRSLPSTLTVLKVLAAVDHGFRELPVIEQIRLIRMMVQRVDYDGAQGKLALMLDPAGLVVALDFQARHT